MLKGTKTSSSPRAHRSLAIVTVGGRADLCHLQASGSVVEGRVGNAPSETREIWCLPV